MSAEILDETGSDLDLAGIDALVVHVLEQMRVHPDAEVCVRFADAAAMEALHIEWMDLPGPTDVMSFPMDEIEPGSDAAGVLGDIVICPEVAAEQARANGHSTADEILLLTVHGLLHLMGYDHAEPEEKAEMFGLQRRLLLTFFASRGRGEDPLPAPTEC